LVDRHIERERPAGTRGERRSARLPIRPILRATGRPVRLLSCHSGGAIDGRLRRIGLCAARRYDYFLPPRLPLFATFHDDALGCASRRHDLLLRCDSAARRRTGFGPIRTAWIAFAQYSFWCWLR
jgi:hypothetical protein